MRVFDDTDLKFYRDNGFFVSNLPVFTGTSLIAFQNQSAGLVNQNLEKEKRAFVDDLHIKHGDFLEFALDYTLLDIVESVIGKDFGLAWSAALIKNKKSEFGVDWHSDFSEGEYHHDLKDHPFVSVTIAASASTQESGCVQFIPGSHSESLKAKYEPGHKELPAAVFAELNPGCFTLHSPHTLHRSVSNRSDYDRILINFWYVSTDVSALSEAAIAYLKSKSAGRVHLRGTDPKKICALSVNDYL